VKLAELQPVPDPWMSEVTRCLGVLWAWYEAIQENPGAISQTGEFWKERYLRLSDMFSEEHDKVYTLTSDNGALRETIDMHVADLASLRAKNEALEAKTKDPFRRIGLMGHHDVDEFYKEADDE